VDTAGRPVSGARVTLTKHEGFFEGFGRALTAVFSLGLACLGEDSICQVPYGQGITNSRGDYTVFLKEIDDYDLDVAARGALVEARVDFAGQPMTLPRVMVWSPTPRLETSGNSTSVVFAGPPAVVGSVERYNAVVSDRTSGTELLVIRGVRSRQTFDTRAMADAPVRLHLSGLVQTKLGDTRYSADYDTRGRLRPPSRGATCVEYGPGTRVKRAASTCRTIDDASYGTTWQPAPVECKQDQQCLRSVGVDLGGVRTVRYVSVIGCAYDGIQGSADGKHWTKLDVTYDGGRCTGDVSAKVRYVRTVPSVSTPSVADLAVWF
jgi:hypothetical protein